MDVAAVQAYCRGDRQLASELYLDLARVAYLSELVEDYATYLELAYLSGARAE